MSWLRVLSGSGGCFTVQRTSEIRVLTCPCAMFCGLQSRRLFLLRAPQTHFKHRFNDMDAKGNCHCKLLCHSFWTTQFRVRDHPPPTRGLSSCSVFLSLTRFFCLPLFLFGRSHCVIPFANAHVCESLLGLVLCRE